MLSGKENVLKWIGQNDAPYWKIYPYGAARNNYIASNDENGSNSMATAIEKLSNTLDLLGSGRYIICAKTKPEQTKGYNEIAFEHQGTNAPATTNASSNQVAGIGMIEMFDQRLVSEIQKLKTEFKMELLEKENADLKLQVKELSASGLESTFNNILKRVDPYLDPALDHFFPVEKSTKIAAVGFSNPTNNKPMNTPKKVANTEEEAAERSRIALQNWADKDPERFLAVVEKIAETIDKDFATYNMYITQLLR